MIFESNIHDFLMNIWAFIKKVEIELEFLSSNKSWAYSLSVL